MLFNDEFVFIHYPKTAGKSLTRYMIEAWNGPIHGHVSEGQMKECKDVMRPDVNLVVGSPHAGIRRAKKLIEERGRNIYQMRAIFIPIRNPYDMTISQYCFMRKNYSDNKHRPNFKIAHDLHFEEFCCFRASQPVTQPEHWMTLNGATISNLEYIRFESLEQDLSSIANRYDFNPATLSHLNRTPHDHYSKYITTRACEEAIFQCHRFLFEQGFYKREIFWRRDT